MIKTLHAFRPLHAFRLFLAGLLASLHPRPPATVLHVRLVLDGEA